MSWTDRFSLAGKRALVTGAAGGIGSQICSVLADAGADIAGLDRDEAGLDATGAVVARHGRRYVSAVADLADAADTVRAAKACLDAFGTIDILVNNAGIAIIEPVLETSIANWDLTMAINLRAPFLIAQVLAPAMIAQKSGKIINISSQAGVIAIEGHASYSASKGGLNLLTKVMMSEWARHNVQVNAVCPTIILTPLGEKVWGDPAKGKPMLDRTPLGRFGKPIEVADLVLFLSSPASDLINGECVLIDAGFTSI
ncbi:MAG: SDR family NAD(P)-dependent oxidoreductase [Labrys sp. (in: a-proteobacteria)]|jgi:NAD(P)-dependent dehydrogenase (short-subunit alcohol dehydrogenase family)